MFHCLSAEGEEGPSKCGEGFCEYISKDIYTYRREEFIEVSRKKKRSKRRHGLA